MERSISKILRQLLRVYATIIKGYLHNIIVFFFDIVKKIRDNEAVGG